MRHPGEDTDGVPVSEASIRLQLTREKVIRRIQTGAIPGGRDVDGRWYVERSALDRALELHAASA